MSLTVTTSATLCLLLWLATRSTDFTSLVTVNNSYNSVSSDVSSSFNSTSLAAVHNNSCDSTSSDVEQLRVVQFYVYISGRSSNNSCNSAVSSDVSNSFNSTSLAAVNISFNSVPSTSAVRTSLNCISLAIVSNSCNSCLFPLLATRATLCLFSLLAARATLVSTGHC